MIARASVSGRALFVCKRFARRSSKDRCDARPGLREPTSLLLQRMASVTQINVGAREVNSKIVDQATNSRASAIRP